MNLTAYSAVEKLFIDILYSALAKRCRDGIVAQALFGYGGGKATVEVVRERRVSGRFIDALVAAYSRCVLAFDLVDCVVVACKALLSFLFLDP